LINIKDTIEQPNLPNGFHLLRVGGVRALTEDAIQIIFEIPNNLKSLFLFIPGQHVDLIVEYEGEKLYRSYSICSGVDEPLSIGVKSMAGGKVSNWLKETVKQGTYLVISEPRGSFMLDTDAKEIVLIGAGSGITPLLSMIKHAYKSSQVPILIYGNKTASSIMFLEDIAKYNSKKVYHFLSAEQKDGTYYGRINSENLSELFKKDVSILQADAYYLCGPGEMIADISSFLIKSGVKSTKIHFELFTAPTNTTKIETNKEISYSGFCKVLIQFEGDKYRLETNAESTTLLELAKKADIDAPFSCKTGVCGSCRAKVNFGSAVMKSNYALTDEEVTNGYILTCQAIPSSSELAISYDD
jgi:ring-1,2-phenylacetyl-CoA epoxidase subunit PaaE